MRKALLFVLALLLLFSLPGAVRAQGEETGSATAEEAPKAIFLPGQTTPLQEEAVESIVEALGEILTLHPEDAPAVLVLQNRPIVTLRARYATNTPQERAEEAVKNFARAVAHRKTPEVSVRKFRPGNILLVGDVGIIGVTRLDLDPLGVERLEETTAKAVENLELVLAEMREQRSLQAILRSVGLSALASLAFAVLLWVVARLQGFLLQRFEAGVKAVEKDVDEATIAETSKVTAATRSLIVLSAWAARFFLTFTWVAFVLGLFPYTRPWGEKAGGFVVGAVQGLALGIARALPNIFSVFLIFLVARLLTRLVRTFFDSVESGRVRASWVFPETAMPTRRLLVFLIWGFALVAMYPYLPGSGSEAFRGLSIIVGLMISLGGSGVVGQAMSGFVLMYSRALRKGDYVRIGDTEGVVLSLGMLATKVRTPKREEITIPNAVVMSTSTKNFSRLAGREGVILHTSVTIGYDAPWRKVHEQLIEAAVRTAGLRKSPGPFVMQTSLSDFFVEYQLNAYLDRPEKRLPVLA